MRLRFGQLAAAKPRGDLALDLAHDRFGALRVATGCEPARRFRNVTANYQHKQRGDRLEDEHPVPLGDRQHEVNQKACGNEAERPETFEIGDVLSPEQTPRLLMLLVRVFK